MTETVLDVRDLHTYFKTSRGTVRAVNGVSFGVEAGGSTGIVGESGSGKSVASLSVMGLIEPPGYIADGSITFQGRDLAKLPEKTMRGIRGRDIGFVFQDPMTALNPVYRVGTQVAEALRAHAATSKRAAMESPRRNGGCTSTRTTSPAACGSGSSSPWR
jgi:ABC-type dipeptide/oligopeptide/nickel transport system ATPase component